MIELEFNPTKAHLAAIKEWLKKEREETNEGFYCNWEVIERAFNNKLVFIGLYNREPVGFMVYYLSAPKLIYDIIEIKPSHRDKGLGKKMVLDSIKYFKEKGVTKVEVDSINEGSEQFCKKLGFVIDDDPIIKSSNNLKLLV